MRLTLTRRYLTCQALRLLREFRRLTVTRQELWEEINAKYCVGNCDCVIDGSQCFCSSAGAATCSRAATVARAAGHPGRSGGASNATTGHYAADDEDDD